MFLLRRFVVVDCVSFNSCGVTFNRAALQHEWRGVVVAATRVKHAGTSSTGIATNRGNEQSPKVSLLDEAEALISLVERQAAESEVRTAFYKLVENRKYYQHSELYLSKDNIPNCKIYLQALCSCAPLLRVERDRHYLTPTSFLDKSFEDSAPRSSPYVDEDAHDYLSAVLQFCIRFGMDDRSHLDALLYLSVAAEIGIGSADDLVAAARVLTHRRTVQQMNPEQIVQCFHVMTLCHKRRQMPLPGTDALLSPLLSKNCALRTRSMILLLSCIARVRGQSFTELTRVISRRLAPAARSGEFTSQDLVFGLRAVAQTGCCSEVFVAAVLDGCGSASRDLTCRELGDICKYLRQLHVSRFQSHLTKSTCSKEIRRLLPRLLQRTEQVVGSFSIRDARHVLACFNAFHLRHSIVFAKLTSKISSG